MHTQKRIRIKDIAEQAGVSIGTVDRVLHNRGEVSVKTTKRIRSLLEASHYTPNLAAKSLSLRKGFRIALLLPEGGTANPYWNKPLEGIRQALEELKDFNTDIDLYGFDTGREKSFEIQFERMISGKPDGIIFAPHFQDSSLKMTAACERLGIPYVFIDTYLETETGLAFFGQDAFQGGYVAAKLLHYGLPVKAKVLVLHLARNKAITSHMIRREQGFLSCFKDHAKEKEVDIIPVTLDLSRSGEPEKSLMPFFASDPGVSGIFVTNSKAHKVASWMNGQGMKHMLMAGYDLIDENMEFIENGTIDFLICQRPEQQGYKSIMAMFSYLLTGKIPDRINYSPIDIVIRENCQCYRNTNPYRR